jgi:hypothetical protein
MTLTQLFGDIADKAAGITAKALGQERVSQYANKDPNNGYACFFTCYYMYFRTVYGYSQTWSEYKAACVKLGAMREDFKILDRSKMAAAAGQRLVSKETASKLREKIYELLLQNKPIPFALNNGQHFESIDGFTVENGKLVFTIDDPGPNNDTRADAETLTVYSAAGKKSGTITKVYWLEAK